MTRVGRVAPRRLSDVRLVVPQGVEVRRRATDGVSTGGRDGKVRVLVRNVTDRRRREAPPSLIVLGYDVPRLLAGNTDGCVLRRLLPVDGDGVRAGEGRVRSVRDLLLGDEGRWDSHGSHGVVDGRWGGRYSLGVRLLGQLVKEPISPSKKAAVLEHLRAGWMKLPEVSLPS